MGMIFVRDPSVLALDGVPLYREEDPVDLPLKKSLNGVGRGLSNMGIIYKKGFGVYWDLSSKDSGALPLNIIKIRRKNVGFGLLKHPKFISKE